jgi:GNAT superfamily N-acetyltransferase
LDDLIDISERDTYRFWSEFARRPGGALGDENGAIWYRSGTPVANYNGVLGVGCGVDAMLDRVRSWGISARWLISTASCGDIETDLARRGLTMTDEYPAMVADVHDVPEPRLDGITVEVASTEHQRREWDDVLCDAFGVSSEASVHVVDAHAWPHEHEPDRIYLILRRDGMAVATALLHTACGAAGVYGIGVRRSHRRQGLGRLATLVTVQAGRERGATLALLQATTDGFPVYEQIGFRPIFAFRSWQIA